MQDLIKNCSIIGLLTVEYSLDPESYDEPFKENNQIISLITLEGLLENQISNNVNLELNQVSLNDELFSNPFGEDSNSQ